MKKSAGTKGDPPTVIADTTPAASVIDSTGPFAIKIASKPPEFEEHPFNTPEVILLHAI